MSFIDWSDPEEMLGLLSEYVADERDGSSDDPAREGFLAVLAAALIQLTDRIDETTSEDLVDRLRAIHVSHAGEFGADPVLIHVEACIEELERIRQESAR
jgi:hypothetical protein